MTDDRLGGLSYRPDIDGLRALAVLSVVLFHFDAALLPGGFVGVDIFFVISGYLITGIIVAGAERGTFSFAEFYRRRVRRIFPVLSVVVLTTLVVGQFVLLPEDLQRLSGAALASQLSLANVYYTYFLDTSYFAADAGLEPLLHIWSLGVEEQFYLIWPLLVVLALRYWKVGRFVAVASLVAAGSFLAGELLVNEQPMFAYYMLPTRAGELLVGALALFAVRSGWFERLPALACQLLGLLGLAAIGSSLFLLSEASPFPGFNALPVALGTALLICSSAAERTWIGGWLATRPMVSVGLISYSLYLWHWPVLAYLKYLVAVPSIEQQLGAGVLMLTLSVLTYRYVERPQRSVTYKLGVVLKRQLALPTLAVAALFLLLRLSDGLGVYALDDGYQSRLASLRQTTPVAASKQSFICASGKITDAELFDPACNIGGPAPRILLWGDSHAAHYVTVLGELARVTGDAFKNVSHHSCPPLVFNPGKHAKGTSAAECRSNVLTVERILSEYDRVVLAAAWSTYIETGGAEFLNDLARSVDQLVASGHSVVLLGQVPPAERADSRCALKQVKVGFAACDAGVPAPRSSIDVVNEHLKALASARPKVTYGDFNDLLCDRSHCAGDLEGEFLYYDRGHLSLFGGMKLGRFAATSWVSHDPSSAAFVPLVMGDPERTLIMPWDSVADDPRFDLACEGAGEALQLGAGLSARGNALTDDLGGGAMLLSDDSPSDSSFVLVTPDASPLAQHHSGYLRLDADVQLFHDGYALLRIFDAARPEEKYDAMISSSTADVVPMFRLEHARVKLTRLDDMIRVSMLIELAEPNRALSIRIYPAISNLPYQYDRKARGSIRVQRVSAQLCRSEEQSPASSKVTSMESALGDSARER